MSINPAELIEGLRQAVLPVYLALPYVAVIAIGLLMAWEVLTHAHGGRR